MADRWGGTSRRAFLRGAVAGAGTLAAGTLLTACAGAASSRAPAVAGSSPSAATSAGARPAARPWTGPLRKFALGGPGGTVPQGPTATDLTTFLPQFKGWYAELGVEFEKINLPASAYFSALDARQLDGVLDVINVPITRSQGLDPIVVWNHQNSQTFHGIARPGLNIRDPNAWGGAKVRVDRLGGFVHVYQSKFIKNLGGDPLKAQYIAVAAPGGFLDVTNSLLVGTFDVNQLSGVGFPYALRNGCQEIGYLPQVMPTPGSGLVVSAARLADDQPYRVLVKDLLRAFLRAHAYWTNAANREEIIALGMEWASTPPELQRADYERALDEELRVATRHGKLQDPQVYRNLFATGLETGVLERRSFPLDYTQYDFREMIDYSLIDQALADEGMAP